MKIILENTADTYKSLQPFETLNEHNLNIKEIRKQFNDKLTPLERVILDDLNLYSCKFPGLSYKCKTKTARQLKISRRTIIRACNKFESLGFIKQYATKRYNGDRRRSSNVIVFVDIKPPVSTDCHNKKALDYTKTLKDTKGTVNTDDLLKKGLTSKMPTRIGVALSTFFSHSEMHEAYGVILRAKASVDKKITIEQHENDYYTTILSVMSLQKRGKIKSSLFGTLYSAIKSLSKKIYVERLFNDAMDAQMSK